VSIIRIAVENHLKHSRLTIRELLEAAYYRKFGKPIPDGCLSEDVSKWERGENQNPYLYDFLLGTECAY
jgi:hypothetical protein